MWVEVWFAQHCNLLSLAKKPTELHIRLTRSILENTKWLAVRIPAVKSPLYLTKNLSGGQLPHVLWRWPIGLLSQKKIGKYFWELVDESISTSIKEVRNSSHSTLMGILLNLAILEPLRNTSKLMHKRCLCNTQDMPCKKKGPLTKSNIKIHFLKKRQSRGWYYGLLKGLSFE